MAESIKRHITHIKSKVIESNKPKLPTAAQIEYGELAVNYAKGHETLSIKNESGNVVTFSSDDYFIEKKLGSGFTDTNSAKTVTEIIEQSEMVTSAALNYLNEVKLDADKIGETIHFLTGMTSTDGGTYLAKNWNGFASEVTDLYTGLCVRFILPTAGHSTGVTLTLNNGEKHPIYFEGTTKLTTHYVVGTVLNLTYDADTTGTYYSGSSTQASVQGVWKVNADYNRDSVGYTIGNYATPKTDSSTFRYMILLQKDEATFTPVNTTSNSTASTKTLTTSDFDPFGTILYKSSTTSISANTTLPSGTTWTQYNVNLAYSFNTTNTLVASKAVYIVAVPQSNGKAKLHSSPISQTLPSTDDGLIYIYLGLAISTTNIFLEIKHPIYYFKDGQLRLYTNSNVDTKVSKTEYATFSAATDISIDDLSGQTETIAAALNDLNDTKLDISAFESYGITSTKIDNWDNAYTKAPIYVYSAITSNINSFTSPIESGTSNNNKQAHVLFHNIGSTEVTVTVPTTYKTPNATPIELRIPVGGFVEVNCLVLNGMIFIRAI